VDLYSAFISTSLSRRWVSITQFYLQTTPYLPPPHKRSPDGATTDLYWQPSNCSLLLICRSRKDERLSWPAANGFLLVIDSIQRPHTTHRLATIHECDQPTMCRIVCLSHKRYKWSPLKPANLLPWTFERTLCHELLVWAPWLFVALSCRTARVWLLMPWRVKYGYVVITQWFRFAVHKSRQCLHS